MKGYNCTFRSKAAVDCNPCFFCRHRDKQTHDHPCCDCIGNEDIALHKPNTETEYTQFEPRSEAHLKVLQMEQEENK